MWASKVYKVGNGRPVPDVPELHLVQASGGLLPVAGDEREGGPVPEEGQRPLHLPGVWERSDSLVHVRSGLTFQGWDAIAANHTEGFSVPNPWTFETGDVHVRVLGPDAAVGTVFTRTSGPRWFILTAALAATPEGWKIIQAHGSYAEDGMDPFGEPEVP